MKGELDNRIQEFEDLLQKIASDMAKGVIHENFPPSALLQKTEKYVDRLKDLAVNSEEFMLVLRPEKAGVIKAVAKNFTQTLTNFKEILLQHTSDPSANSRLAFEQLRKALADGSDFLFLMREVRDNPSPLIEAILNLRKASETRGSVINIKAREDVEPLIKYVLGRIDEFRAALVGLEKKVGEMKQIMRELQEESLKILSGDVTDKPKTVEADMDKKQLLLSNFKTAEK